MTPLMSALFSAFVCWLRLSRVRALRLSVERLKNSAIHTNIQVPFREPSGHSVPSVASSDWYGAEFFKVNASADRTGVRGHVAESVSARARRQGPAVLEPREKRQQISWLKWSYV
jgi:hypothetical protein